MMVSEAGNVKVGNHRTMVSFLRPAIVVEYVAMCGDAFIRGGEEYVIDLVFWLSTGVICRLRRDGQVLECVRESIVKCPLIYRRMYASVGTVVVPGGIEISPNETGRPQDRHVFGNFVASVGLDVFERCDMLIAP
jgi:hypothetical protein